MQSSIRSLLGGTLVVVLAACSSEDSLGRTGGAASGTVAGSASGPSIAPPACMLPDPTGGGSGSETPSTVDAWLVGTWIGYLESYQKPDSDQIKLVIPEGSASGHVVFGDRPPPAPASSAKSAYPEDFAIGAMGAPLAPYQGFEYSLRELVVDGGRVRFALASRQLWRDWCPLQHSYAGGPGGCGCLPEWTGHVEVGNCSLEDPDTHQTMQVTCAQFGLCSFSFQTCVCSVSGCRANEVSDARFDLDLQGDQLDGSMVTAWWGDYPVHLSRVASAGPSP